MYAPYYAFAIFYLLHMIVYTSIELLEPEIMVGVLEKKGIVSKVLFLH